jgi:hypothetical protein
MLYKYLMSFSQALKLWNNHRKNFLHKYRGFSCTTLHDIKPKFQPVAFASRSASHVSVHREPCKSPPCKHFLLSHFLIFLSFFMSVDEIEVFPFVSWSYNELPESFKNQFSFLKRWFRWLSTRVQWFWLFHILRYNHPSLTPKGPKDLEIGKKKFSTSSMDCGNFWQKPENAFFWSGFKV